MNLLIAILLMILIFVVSILGLIALSMFKRMQKVSQAPPTIWPLPLQTEIEKTQPMSKRNKQAITNPMPTLENDGRLHDTKNKKAQFLVPENLTESERQILKDFYNV